MSRIASADKTDISMITLESESGTLGVSFDLTIGEQGEVASYTEEIDMNEAPEHLRLAATKFVDAVMLSIHERVTRQGDVRCLTCTGACCWSFDTVCVTQADVDRMKEAGVSVESSVKFYPEHALGLTDWTGNVGEMNEKPMTDQISALAAEAGVSGCVHLTQQGCAIYESRPQVCRDFSAWTCESTYEEDPRKVAARKSGKMTLRVMKQ